MILFRLPWSKAGIFKMCIERLSLTSHFSFTRMHAFTIAAQHARHINASNALLVNHVNRTTEGSHLGDFLKLYDRKHFVVKRDIMRIKILGKKSG